MQHGDFTVTKKNVIVKTRRVFDAVMFSTFCNFRPVCCQQISEQKKFPKSSQKLKCDQKWDKEFA